MATYPVKYITNTMRGAPQISGQAGTLQAALRAFLLTGFGLTTALSVTVAGGIATASLNEGQTFAQGCVVLVDGGTPAQINGEARVLTSSNSAITWATTAPDGPATGAITIKVAPVGGWEELFPGTPNKSVFRSIDPQASGFCYRVDDSGTTQARVRGFESMTDIDTGTGPFPTDTQISGGGYTAKSYSEGATPVSYLLAADSRTVLIAISSYSSILGTYTVAPIRGFGDMLPLAPDGDPYSAAISCNSNSGTASFGAFGFYRSGAASIYCPRPRGGIGSAVRADTYPYVGNAATVSGVDPKLGAFPSNVDGELKYCRQYIAADETLTPRADVPGVLYIPQTGVGALIKSGDTLQGSGALAGRTLRAVGANSSADAEPIGAWLIDVTGPWR